MLSSTASRQLSASVPSTLAGALLSEPPRAPLPSVRLWPPEGGGSAGCSSHSPFQRTGPDPAGGSGYDAAGRHLVPTIPRAGFAPPHELGAGPGGPGGPGGAGYSPLLPPVAHAGAGWGSGEGPSNPFQLAEHSGGRGVAGARPGVAPLPGERGSPGAGAGEERPPKRIALARTAAFVPTRPVMHAPALTQYQQLRARQAELAQELAANSSRQAAMAAAMLAGGELPPSPPARQRPPPPPAAAAAGGQDLGTAELQALLRQVLAAAGAGGGGPQASQQLLLAALLGMQSRERGRAPLQDGASRGGERGCCDGLLVLWGGRGKKWLASQVPVLLGECCCMVLAHRRCAHTGNPLSPPFWQQVGTQTCCRCCKRRWSAVGRGRPRRTQARVARRPEASRFSLYPP